VKLIKNNFRREESAKSEIKIICSLYNGDKRFTELLKETRLSKPVLSARLKGLTKRNLIFSYPKTKGLGFIFLYSLKRREKYNEDMLIAFLSYNEYLSYLIQEIMEVMNNG